MTTGESHSQTGPLTRQVGDVSPPTTPLGRPAPKVYIICNQGDTAPAWGYILRQKGVNTFIETSVERKSDRSHVVL